jgi:hypothetical protein
VGCSRHLRENRVHPAARERVASKERAEAALVHRHIGDVVEAGLDRLELRVVASAALLDRGAELPLLSKGIGQRPGLGLELEETLEGAEVVEDVLEG